MHAIPASQLSIDPGNWEEVLSCLSDDLIFTSKPRFSAIPLQGHLVQVRHQSVKSRSDLRNCALSGKRIWVRGRDPNTSKRKLSQSSSRILKLYALWLGRVSPLRSMWPKPTWQGLCVADAFASGDDCGIGGAIYFPSGSCSWFSLPMTGKDFKQLQIPMHEDLQKDISALEALAQIALVYIAVNSFPGSRIPIRVPTLSDNTGAEAISNKLFTTQMPMALFMEKLCLLISSSHTEVDVSHIPGKNNDIADALSRWNGTMRVLHLITFYRKIDSIYNFLTCGFLNQNLAWCLRRRGFLGNSLHLVGIDKVVVNFPFLFPCWILTLFYGGLLGVTIQP